MKTVLHLSLLAQIPFIAILLFPSCQKELSCESCIDHNPPPIALAGPGLTITLPILVSCWTEATPVIRMGRSVDGSGLKFQVLHPLTSQTPL